MKCTSPLPAWCSKFDFKSIVFSSERGIPSTHFYLPCGQCICCRLKRARDWAHRCVHESSLHEQNCFITLTYDDDNLIFSDSGATLYHRHFQLFMKRLRKSHSDITIRYFMCGEYGDLFSRPHYHACIFGYDFPDKEFFFKSGSYFFYTSQELLCLWPHGNSTISDLTFDTACYTARYVMKKITGDDSFSHYGIKYDCDGKKFYSHHPEYCAMSRRPGIGRLWYDKYKSDLYNKDICVTKASFISKPPKYYDNLYSSDNPDHFQDIKRIRKDSLLDDDIDWNDLDRLSTYYKVKQSKLSRKYESR